MKKAIGRLLAWIGGLVMVIALLLLAVGIVAMAKRKRVPERTVVELNLEQPLAEAVSDEPLVRLMGQDRPVVRDLIEALQRAADDPRVQGLVARLGAAPMGLAQVQEIRDAIIAFRERKKFAVAFAETFGEFGPGSASYYLATAFDEIYLQPSGDVVLTGMMMESPFLRGTLDKLDVVPRMDHRYEYKAAMNLFTEKHFTPAHREEMEKVLTSMSGQLVRGIAAGRRLSEEEVRSLIDRAPLLGREAVDAHLVDGLCYRDEVYAKVKERAGKGQLLYLDKYLKRAGRPHDKGKAIALIFGEGGVHRGKSSYDPQAGTGSMGSDTVTAAFRAAIDDHDVRAIIFRIDSPGGSYVASDAIWQEVMRARGAGKPVIATMGNVAASGGYFAAMAADKIVAQPATITGSIGVLGGKMLSAGLWDKLGVSWDEVHAGANATMWTGTKDYTPAEWARFQAWLDRVYADFTDKVAQGRKLPKDRVLQLAKGRIWSGEDAKNLGLVDELGGFPVALRLARSAANLSETEDVKLEIFPRPHRPLQILLAKLSGSEPEDNSDHMAVDAGQDAATEVLVGTLEAVQPILRRLGVLTTGKRGVLTMPPIQERY